MYNISIRWPGGDRQSTYLSKHKSLRAGRYPNMGFTQANVAENSLPESSTVTHSSSNSWLRALVRHPFSSMSLEAAVQAVIHEGDRNARSILSTGCSLSALQDALIANYSPLSEMTLSLCDALAYNKPEPLSLNEMVTSAKCAALVHNSTRVLVWQGDITRLALDAVVNAANAQGLGCFDIQHRCLDNVIHRTAGPRLREQCRAKLAERRLDLAAGNPPLLTAGFRLPARHVLHVTGPRLSPGASPTDQERAVLAAAYLSCLDACVEHGLRSIAFNCLSTGLFCFPADIAAAIALSTVADWLQTHPDAFDYVVFDVFLDSDLHHYRSLFASHFKRSLAIVAAAHHIQEASSVLLVAGAGLGAHLDLPFNVYVNEEHFSAAYPDMAARGFRTAYDTMSLYSNRHPLPDTVKWGFFVRHMHNMSRCWPPSEGHSLLREVLSGKDVFVLTSNVDEGLSRVGFERVFTPQGSWAYYQCATPCSTDSVWPSNELLDSLVPLVDDQGHLPPDAVPSCKACGGRVLPNVRAGGWFSSHPHIPNHTLLESWLQQHAPHRLLVLEIGCGFNTPSVTRFVSESIVYEYTQSTQLVRINPLAAHAARGDLAHSVGVCAGWPSLRWMSASASSEVLSDALAYVLAQPCSSPIATALQVRLGHFDWRRFLGALV